MLGCLPCPVPEAQNSEERNNTENSEQGNEDCLYQVITWRVNTNSLSQFFTTKGQCLDSDIKTCQGTAINKVI